MGNQESDKNEAVSAVEGIVSLPEEYKETECSCEKCALMCEQRPCWPTPNEAKALIEAGYGDRLMADYWVDYPDNIDILSPAIVGSEGSRAPFWPTGRCTFLTEDGLCELHDKGLKPLEGRIATCDENVEYEENPHEFIAELWDNTESRNVVEKWFNEVAN